MSSQSDANSVKIERNVMEEEIILTQAKPEAVDHDRDEASPSSEEDHPLSDSSSDSQPIMASHRSPNRVGSEAVAHISPISPCQAEPEPISSPGCLSSPELQAPAAPKVSGPVNSEVPTLPTSPSCADSEHEQKQNVVEGDEDSEDSCEDEVEGSLHVAEDVNSASVDQNESRECGIEDLLMVKIEEGEDNVLMQQDDDQDGDMVMDHLEDQNTEAVRDPVWDEFEEVEGYPLSLRCKKCKTHVSPRANRLKSHLSKCVYRNKRKRGRPRKYPAGNPSQQRKPGPAGRGRPRKILSHYNLDRRRPVYRSGEKQCLLCGVEVLNADSSWARSPDSTFRVWAESCANSMCELLKLDQSFYNFFLASDYCQPCREMCSDIDWTLKSINVLQQRLKRTQETVEYVLKENYEAISAEAKNFSFSFVSNINSYEHIVKTIYDALFLTVEQQPLIIRRRGRPPGRKRKYEKQSAFTGTLKVERENDTNSIKIKRPRAIISMADISDEEEGDRTEVKVNNGEGGQDEFAADKWVPPDNSNDDEDWESSRAKLRPKRKYKPGRKPREHREGRSTGEPLKHKCAFENCSFSANKLFNLEVHVRQRHEGSKTPYKCKHCEKQFKTFEILGYHMKRHSAAKIPCTVTGCTKKFFDKATLRKHISWKHYLHDRHICIYCNKTFGQKDEEDWKTHTGLHESETIPFSCVISGCTFTPTNSLDLKKHVAHLHEEKTIVCELCPGKLFSSFNSLKSHRQKEHVVGDGEGFKCNVADCGYIGKKKSDLIRHNGSHITEKTFQCETCGSSYKNKGSLTRHIMTHTGECKYKCKICNKSFNMGHKLKNHEEIHAITKSYLCPKCGKAFRALKNLQQHTTYHCFSDSAERPKVVKRNRRVNKTSSSSADLPINAHQPNEHRRSGSEKQDTEKPSNSSNSVLNPSQLACIATYTDTMNNERISIPIMRGPGNSGSEINLPHHGRNWGNQQSQAQQQFHHPNAFLGQSFNTLDLSQASNFMPSTSSASQFGMIPNQGHWNFVP